MNKADLTGTNSEGCERIPVNRTPRVIFIRTLTITLAILLLSVAILTANALVDLTGIYKPFLGERGAKYLQGIHKTVTNDGIELAVEAAYTDGINVLLFYTLTDTECKSRLNVSMNMNTCLDYWPGGFTLDEGYTFIGGGGGNEPLEISPDGNSGRYCYSTTQESGISSGRLMVFRLCEFKTGFIQSNRSWENVLDGEWNVTFRLDAGYKAEPQPFQVSLPNGLALDTVTITPISVVFRGTGDYDVFQQMTNDSINGAFELIDADGKKVVTTGGCTSATNRDGGEFTVIITGVISDEIAAVRINGVDYELEYELTNNT